MLKILYGDVDDEAIAQARIDTYGYTDFSKIYQLKRNLVYPNYSNPCDGYSTLLDGNSLPIPSDNTDAVIGYWSDIMSTNVFSENTKGFNFEGAGQTRMMLTTVNSFSTSGFTIVFDKNNDVYPTYVEVIWLNKYQVPLSEKIFYPDSSEYFFENQVNDFAIVTFAFYSLNVPNGRLKIQKIKYGVEAIFEEDEIEKIKISNEINPISVDIPISTCDISINTKKNIGTHLGQGGEIRLYANDTLISRTFVESSRRLSKTKIIVKSEDLISILDKRMFAGDFYENEDADSILQGIFGYFTYDYVYHIDEDLKNIPLSGFIPYCTQREALMQVAFAIGAIVDTSNSDWVKILKRPTEPSEQIGLSRVMQGQRVEYEKSVSAVELTEHSYVESDEEVVLYESAKNGTGTVILVVFDEPIHYLTIENGSIFQATGSRAVINANEGCVLRGKRYLHNTVTHSRKNHSATNENVVKIEDATLISSSNVDNVLDLCYNYYASNKKVISKIAERKNVEYSFVKYGKKKYSESKYGDLEKVVSRDTSINVGERIVLSTEYSGDVECLIEKETYNLSSGTIVKEIITR